MIFDKINKVLELSLQSNQTIDFTYSPFNQLAIFTQSEEEYLDLLQKQQELCLMTDNPKQKYFKLNESMESPEFKIEWLYVRKPDYSEYGKNLGDVDYLVDSETFNRLKNDSRFILEFNEGIGELIYLKSKLPILNYFGLQEVVEMMRFKP